MDKSWSLKNKRDIENLFSKGKSYTSGCIVARYVDSTETKFLFAVSTRLYKRANKRNRVKRLMRVAVAEIKNTVVNKHVAFIYIDTDIKSLSDIKNSIAGLKCLNP
jgi:ribonuclease P protein component